MGAHTTSRCTSCTPPCALPGIKHQVASRTKARPGTARNSTTQPTYPQTDKLTRAYGRRKTDSRGHKNTRCAPRIGRRQTRRQPPAFTHTHTQRTLAQPHHTFPSLRHTCHTKSRSLSQQARRTCECHSREGHVILYNAMHWGHDQAGSASPPAALVHCANRLTSTPPGPPPYLKHHTPLPLPFKHRATQYTSTPQAPLTPSPAIRQLANRHFPYHSVLCCCPYYCQE